MFNLKYPMVGRDFLDNHEVAFRKRGGKEWNLGGGGTEMDKRGLY